MNKRNVLVLTVVFLFFYLLNYFMPMTFGDDYLYSFIWQGNPMFVPLSETAIRISNIDDLVISQWSHYFTWSGRLVSHTIAQFFLWCGKDVFNVCNAFISLLLVIEIYWCIHKGKITLDFNPCMLCWIVFVLWAFIPRFPSSALWMVGSCNYLWSATLLIAFLIPYIKKYYCFKAAFNKNIWFSIFIFFFGIIAGCTNENSVCWIILLLSVFIYFTRKATETETWMYAGYVGLVIGYALLMFAPGNYNRLLSVHGHNWFTLQKILDNLRIFAQVLVWQFILWYYCIRSIFSLNSGAEDSVVSVNDNLKKDIFLVKVLSLTAMGMSAILLFSPEFHLRSTFSGTVLLIIAAGIVVHVQNEYGIQLLQENVKRFLTGIGVVCFIISTGVTLHHLNEHRLWHTELLSQVTALQRKHKEKETVLEIKPLKKSGKLEDFMSGFHTFENNLSEDETSWENVCFARYYGIKGIRLMHSEDAVTDQKE